MADSDPVTWQLALLIQAQLQLVRVSNGYFTDIGALVAIEDSQVPADSTVLPTFVDVNTTTRSTDPNTNRRQRSVEFTIEANIAVTLTNAKQTAHRVVADVERVLDQRGVFAPKYIRMAKATKAEIVSRPEGMNVILVKVTGEAIYLPPNA